MSKELSLNIDLTEFRKNGFIILDNFISSEELIDFKNDLEKVISLQLKKNHVKISENDYLSEGIIALKKKDTRIIGEIYDTIAQMPSFFRIVAKKETSLVINQLLNKQSKDPLYMFTPRCRIDPPVDTRRTYGWHQEVFYSVPHSHFIQTWAPMIYDTSKENGTIEVRVGSHLEGIAEQDWSEPEGRAIQILVKQDIVEKYPLKIIEMKLGQMLFFDYRLFHQSGTNSSDKVRYSLVGMYHDIDNNKFKPAGIRFDYGDYSPRQFYEDFKNKKKL